jgi:glycosyltransferase involved in cell wall biosynthesis
MRVLMLSKACVVGAYQRKLEEIASLGVELTVVVPPEWRDERGVQTLERAHLNGYDLIETPILFNGNFHLHFYPRFTELVARWKPDLVHIDEEPYNLATWLALRSAKRHGAKALFFSWQNLHRRYPPPFNWIERSVLDRADAAIVGNVDSEALWRAKGYRGPVRVIPQFGVDPELFKPTSGRDSDAVTGGEVTSPRHPVTSSPHPFTVGYAGRLVPEKGVDVLLLAAAQVPEVQVRILGAGPEHGLLEHLIAQHGLRERAVIERPLPSTAMPEFYSRLDCLVLPSRTRPNWKEQFGRVLIEAMACGVPVVGSTCGEIPNVIGAAGLTFPEEHVETLAAQLRLLQRNAERRAQLSAAGRARVLALFTQRRIAEQTVDMYRFVMGQNAD